MSDFIKKFTSIFVVDEEEKTSRSRNADVAPSSDDSTDPHREEANVKKTPDRSATPTKRPEVSKRMTKLLLKAMEENNLPGFDYLEFKQALLSLKNMDMDEATRYKSVLTMAKAMGGTLEQIQQSAEHYIGVLKKEYMMFQKTLEKRTREHVLRPQEEMKVLSKKKEEREALIQKLRGEMAQIDQQIDKIKEKTQLQISKISRAKNEFEVTYEHMTDIIMRDLEQVNRHLDQ